MASAKSDAIKAELEAIRKRHDGRLSKHDVVRWAQANKKSALHSMFDWDTKSAALKHWLDRADELIVRYITIVTVHKAIKVITPYYVRDPSAKPSEAGYVALTGPDLDLASSQQIVLAELDKCEFAINRARGIAHVLDARFPRTSDRLQEMLEALVILRRSVAA